MVATARRQLRTPRRGAFGRLMTVKNRGTSATVAEYKYNGLGYRIGWHFDADVDTDVDASDPWVYFQYDERWRVVATWRASDLLVREQYIYHAAGSRGLGGSSYIDSVVLRDRDPGAWTIATADEMTQRRYYCQNWRADVSVILPSTGCDASGGGPGILEWIKYSAYGVPQSFSMADYNRDGAKNSTDYNGTTGDFDIDFGNGNLRADVNYDGGVTIDDLLLIANAASEAAPRGTQSCASTNNRIGYAGYQWDPVVSVNHVRHRVYVPELGRWTRRDPLGYVDGMGLYEYVGSHPITKTDPSGLEPCVNSASGCNDNVAPPDDGVPFVPDLPPDFIGPLTEEEMFCGQVCRDGRAFASTVCFRGRLIICFCGQRYWREFGANSLFGRLYLPCLRAHEDTNAEGFTCTTPDGTPVTGRPLPLPGTNPRLIWCNEARAYERELSCLINIDCQNDPWCEYHKCRQVTFARCALQALNQACARARGTTPASEILNLYMTDREACVRKMAKSCNRPAQRQPGDQSGN